jgi:hypothetical protein
MTYLSYVSHAGISMLSDCEGHRMWWGIWGLAYWHCGMATKVAWVIYNIRE